MNRLLSVILGLGLGAGTSALTGCLCGGDPGVLEESAVYGDPYSLDHYSIEARPSRGQIIERYDFDGRRYEVLYEILSTSTGSEEF